MLATFCLRLACGLACSLLVLTPEQVNPRFYRVQFLTILGLAVSATVTIYARASLAVWLALALVSVCGFAGSLVWSLSEAPGGRWLVVVTAAGSLAALSVAQTAPSESASAAIAAPALWWTFADDATSALLLGAATTSMLMGHSYLIAPGMSLTPLFRLLTLLMAATLARMALVGVGLWFWTAEHSLGNLEDETVLWLPLRWGLGLVAPLVLGWMAWQTARIRSTQSATGILYVVVVFCFLGELTSQLLVRNTGFVL